jgi:hypothetical protein
MRILNSTNQQKIAINYYLAFLLLLQDKKNVYAYWFTYYINYKVCCSLDYA